MKTRKQVPFLLAAKKGRWKAILCRAPIDGLKISQMV
jgi:hypothetical protein